MAPVASKANYKSYEAQARLVRAIVAAHPNTKWNYKEIAACYGSDMTEHALNHRFRHIRAQTEIINEGRKAGFDIKDLIADEGALPKTVGGVEKHNIAKYFGQSTGDGIQFQFRTIKKDADKMRDAVDKGHDPSSCLDLGTGSGPSSSFTPTTTPKTQRTRNIQTPTTGGSTKRRAQPATYVKIEDDEDDDDDDDDSEAHNWSEMDQTPSKRAKKMTTGATPGQKNGTPRAAAARASATIADVSAQLGHTSESEVDAPSRAPPRMATNGFSNGAAAAARPSSSFATTPTPMPVVQPAPSLFGHVAQHQSYAAQPPPMHFQANHAFSSTGTDAYIGGGGYYEDDDDDGIHGEI